MSKIEKIEQEIQALSPEEPAQFRAWFLEYDWVIWDRRIERDAESGRPPRADLDASPLGVDVSRESERGSRRLARAHFVHIFVTSLQS
jgi:hypothetical protein